jgi:Copper transport outer membrane protein, MctB
VLNLRYHIVSLVAVFLALGIGIIMGSSFISRVTVDQLRKRLDTVDASVRQTRKTNDALTTQIRTWERFADQGRPQLLAGQLKGVPVVIVGVQGIDRKAVDDFTSQLSVAGAVSEGTVWLTPKLNLSTQGDVNDLAAALGVAPDSPDVLRATALSRLAMLLGGTGDPGGLLPALRQAGFVAYEQPPSPSSSTTVAPPAAPGGIPLPNTRTVVISGAGARLEDDTMTLPFLVQLGLEGAPVVAAEAGQDTPGGRGVFVGLVRRNVQTSPRISTVDNLESFIGQAATVFALSDLRSGPVGHYGVGPGAQRLLPDLSAGT